MEIKPPTEEPEDVQMEIADTLATIAEHLKSIRGMLTFFTVLTVIGFILTACNVLMSI